MPAFSHHRQIASSRTPSVGPARVAVTRAARAGTAQRAPACACGGTCPRCRAGENHDHGAAHEKPAPPIVDEVLRAEGRPLEPDVRASMEERFDRDFSAVRVHTGAQADASARSVQALAYTVGRDSVFAAGRYAPHTDAGQRILAHELTHVVQQAGAAPCDHLAIGDTDDALEREAERTAASVVNGGSAGPVRVSTDRGVQMLRRQTDASVESGTGADTGITNGTLTEVAGVHGATFDASDCFGEDTCDVHFQFEKAYVGTYPYVAAGGRTVRGAYVKIVMNAEPECGRCSTLEAVQVIRNTRRTRSGRGRLVTADPVHDVRRRRSGWDDADAPSRGWRVDTDTSATDPFYSHTWVGLAGGGGSPATIWDTPGDWDTNTNVGKDFQTCLICVSRGTRSTLGCVHWGYYTDSSGSVSFLPATPVPNCGSTRRLRDAAKRWEGIPGNDPLNLVPHVVPPPMGDFPMPTGDERMA